MPLHEEQGLAMADYISERTAGQIIGDSIRLYLRHLPVIFVIYGLPIFPFIVIEAATAAGRDETTNLIALVVEMVISMFTIGAVTFAVSDICLGNKPSVKRSYGALFRVFWAYLGTYLLYVAATMIGMMLLVVPGIIALLLLLFCLQVAVIERRGPIESCKRSIRLGKGYYWRNFGVALLAVLLAVVVVFVIGMTFGIIALLADSDPEGFAFSLAVGILGALAAPLLQIPAILLYYDMRARKEHFDGAALSQELMV
jgi:hypothetical protein